MLQIQFFRQESLRKEFTPSIGGTGVCYFPKKHVYVVEWLNAEGHFIGRALNTMYFLNHGTLCEDQGLL